MDTNSATNPTPASYEFQRAFLFSFKARQEHPGNLVGAFWEFTDEPDITAHWENLGETVVADMLTTATRLAYEARIRGGGGNVDTLPDQIRDPGTFGPLVDIAGTLIHTLEHDGETVTTAECVRLVADLHMRDVVAVFAALVMTLFPPRGAAS